MVFSRIRWGWDPKGWAAVAVYTTFAVLMINFLGEFGAGFAIPRWCPTRPDAMHSYAIRFKGGSVYFVQPWLGKYFVYGFWAHFILLGFIFLLMWLHRNEVERYD